MTRLLIEIDYSSKAHLYEQLVDALTESIENGLIKCGERLPSIRELAEHLGVARHTVSYSYEILKSRGLIQLSGNKAMVVFEESQDVFPQHRSSSAFAIRPSRFACELAKSSPVEILAGFNSGAAAAEHLPLRKWKSCLSAYLSDDTPILYPDRDPLGVASLRNAIAPYLRRSHGVSADGSDVGVFTEARQAIELMARLFIDPGDTVVVENPGSRWARQIFKPYQAIIEAVPIDEDGLIVHRLDSIQKKIKLVYVTPSHHDPTGAVMSIERRQALVEWANDHSALVIEDHTDGQYCYASRPLPALQTFDRAQCVVYISTFWKVLYPLVKLGFGVFPPAILNLVRSEISRAQRDSLPALEQHALADFINQGAMDQHIRKMTKLYLKRRDVLLTEFRRCFGTRVKLAKESAGLQQHLTLDVGLPDEKILHAAREADLPLVSLAPFFFNNTSEGQFVLPFSRITEAQLERRIRLFAHAINLTN